MSLRACARDEYARAARSLRSRYARATTSDQPMGGQDQSQDIAYDLGHPSGMLVAKSCCKSQKVAKSFGGIKKNAYICSD